MTREHEMTLLWPTQRVSAHDMIKMFPDSKEAIRNAFMLDYKLLAIDPEPTWKAAVRAQARAKAARDEEIVRELLGHWVSELDPAIAYQNGEVIGLCLADDWRGTILVRTPIERFARAALDALSSAAR